MPFATWSVSPLRKLTDPSGSPSRAATICANVVSWPCPCESEPVRTIAVPSARDLDLAELGLGDRVRDLDVDAHADPELLGRAVGAPARLLGAQLVEPGRVERQVERALVVAGVVRRVGRGRVRERVARDQVTPPHLDRVEADLGREQVDRPLDRLARLGPPGSAERGDGGRVRDHRVERAFDAWDRVHAARHQQRQVRQERAEHGIRAAVLEQVEPVGEHLAVARPAELELHVLRAAVVIATMLSLRVSVQRTGRSTRPASQTIRISSTLSSFAPKPPPTSGLMIRSCDGSSPSVPAIPSRSMCGACVVSQAVIRPSGAASAAAERGSSGHGAMRWLRASLR